MNLTNKQLQKITNIITDKMKSPTTHSISKTFWGQAWNNIFDEHFYYSKNAKKGRALVRNNMIKTLKVDSGSIEAQVKGSSSDPYTVRINIHGLKKSMWNIPQICAVNHLTYSDLKKADIPKQLQKNFVNKQSGIFPSCDQMIFFCNCPLKSNMCKHVFAVLYTMGMEIDINPELLFKVIQVDIPKLKALDCIEQFPPKIIKKTKMAKLRGQKISQTKQQKKRQAEKCATVKSSINPGEQLLIHNSLTGYQIIENYIYRSRKGVTIYQLEKKTGYSRKKIYNIIYKLKCTNKIRSIAWGTYLKI